MTIRICVWPGCETRLSRYNPLDRCSLHEGAGDPRYSALMMLTDEESEHYYDGSWLK